MRCLPAGCHFRGQPRRETISRILQSQPEAMARFHYSLPIEFERIIRKCLEKDPERRYQSARDLQVDLRNLKRDCGSGIGGSASLLETRKHSTYFTLVALTLALL